MTQYERMILIGIYWIIKLQFKTTRDDCGHAVEFMRKLEKEINS